MSVPFCLLLVMIAFAPVTFPVWWERNYIRVCLALSLLTFGIYLFAMPGDFAMRTVSAGWRFWGAARDALSLITLIGGLFVVAGGIHIRPGGRATPAGGVLFLTVGALLSNLFGTTGASVLLIRPWIQWTRNRPAPHQIVFFIFIVSNIGGSLTPVGDPPLLAGWLRGIPFWWMAVHGWPVWCMVMTMLLAAYFTLDSLHARQHQGNVGPRGGDVAVRWTVQGWPNLAFLILILAATFIKKPAFLREAVIIAAAVVSYRTTRPEIRQAAGFDPHPLIEISFLFLALFITMIPALDWIEFHAKSWATPGVSSVYWATGAASSVLDNMPSYLAVLQTCLGSLVEPEVVVGVQKLLHHGSDVGASPEVLQTFEALRRFFPGEAASGAAAPDTIRMACLLGNARFHPYLLALGFGAVFFGACTYIGNAPNLVVRAIAARSQAAPPSFAWYVVGFVVPLLLPMLALLWWLFFRG
jgi:Na+/H+ antiporter NhaD/arsenite permease-like protein